MFLGMIGNGLVGELKKVGTSTRYVLPPMHSFYQLI
jgi:hypothetical protein